MKNYFFVVLPLVFLQSILLAQNTPIDLSQIRCSFIQNNPQDNQQILSFENWLHHHKTTTLQSIQERNEDNTIIKIPVIFHVIHYGEEIGGGTNLATSQIMAQLEQVNNDLRKKEGTSGYNDFNFGADIQVELAPAILDENDFRIMESGINRINAIEAGFNNNAYSETYFNSIIKPATQWNPNLYLNVWVTDLSSGVLGYAQFPEASGLPGLESLGTPITDGIVLSYQSVGSTEIPNILANASSYENYNKGRTFTHELGHWLGLRHTWGDGGCSSDDFCLDTPYCEGANYGCTNSAYSCSSQDLTENYMDYTNDECMSVFTEDQKIRIHTVLNNSTRRVELLSSDRATAPASIDLTSFNVHLENWDAVIHWSTSFEYYNSHFSIYKSKDGENYTKIGDVSGAGFSTGDLSYQFIDPTPNQGTNYYKLIQLDYDGTENQVGVRTFEYYLGFKMLIEPNPTKGDLNISIWTESEGEATLQIYDLAGRRLFLNTKMLNIGPNYLDLDIDYLPKGVYFFQVIKGPWQRSLKINKA